MISILGRVNPQGVSWNISYFERLFRRTYSAAVLVVGGGVRVAGVGRVGGREEWKTWVIGNTLW